MKEFCFMAFVALLIWGVCNIHERQREEADSTLRAHGYTITETTTPAFDHGPYLLTKNVHVVRVTTTRGVIYVRFGLTKTEYLFRDGTSAL